MGSCDNLAGMDEAHLDGYLRGLFEVQEELEELEPELKTMAGEFASAQQADQPSSEHTRKHSLPGFRAYHLATEGLALLNLLALSAALLGKSIEVGVNSGLSQKLTMSRAYVKRLRPPLRTLLEQMACTGAWMQQGKVATFYTETVGLKTPQMTYCKCTPAVIF